VIEGGGCEDYWVRGSTRTLVLYQGVQQMNDITRTNGSTAIVASDRVRVLTENASFDNLAQADYWQMYQELRGDMSLSKFAEKMGEYPSKAEWSRWDRGEVEARRGIRNALRKAKGLPALPETVADTIAQHAHPDSRVLFLGDGEVGDDIIIIGDMASFTFATGATSTDTGDVAIDAVPARTTSRQPCYRPVCSVELKEMANEVGETIEELARWAIEMKKREV
jgi:hypothetical protein